MFVRFLCGFCFCFSVWTSKSSGEKTAVMFPCKEDTQYVENVKIIWQETSTWTISRPMCIGDNLEPVKRYCNYGVWQSKPYCRFIQSGISRCPEDFSLLDNNVCHTILRPGPFHRKCPYPNVLSYEEYRGFLNKITHDEVWLPIFRDDDDADGSIGDYYYVEASDSYGENFLVSLDPEESITSKLCAVKSATKMSRLVKCNESHPKVCIYKTISNGYNEVCKTQLLNNICFGKYMGVETACVCLADKKNQNDLDRGGFCKHLAELNHPYQNEVKGLIDDGKRCWIGLERQNGAFVWSGTKSQVNYTNWLSDTDFHMNFASLHSSGWSLHPNRALDCALCEEKLDFPKPKLRLRYEARLKKLELRIDNYGSVKVLSKGNDPDLQAVCFFRPGQLYTKERILRKYISVKAEGGTMIYHFSPFADGPAFYWCQAFRHPHLELVESNTVFHYDREFGYEYVAKINKLYEEGSNPLANAIYTELYEHLNNRLTSDPTLKVRSVRKSKILAIDEEKHLVQFLLHISTGHHDVPNRDAEHAQLKSLLVKVLEELGTANLDELRSSNFCLRNVTLLGNVSVSWPTTAIGTLQISKEFCMSEGDKPLMRRCSGDFTNGARWSAVSGSCSLEIPKSEITNDLNSLLEDDELPPEKVVEALANITENFVGYKEIDVFLVGRILEKVASSNSVCLVNVTKVVNQMIKTRRSVLLNSQVNYNATDGVLRNYDDILKSNAIVQESPHALIRTDNLIVLAVNLNKTNISGLALFSSAENGIEVAMLNISTKIEEVMATRSFQAALVLEERLLGQIRAQANASYTLTAFLSDSLFNEIKHSKKEVTGGIIFGLLIPGFDEEFRAPIMTYHKPNATKSPQKYCSHWQFATDDVSSALHSFWKESGNISQENAKLRCEFWHATHFGLLVIASQELIDPNVDPVLLSVITTTNCIFSVVGLAVIFFTSAVFKTWRTNTGNLVLLNFSLAIFLQIVLLYVSDLLSDEGINKNVCLIIGALLHYSVISEFCWMFVIGVLQFKRLVVVFVSQTSYVLLKSCAIGWAVPLLPVLALLLTSPNSYLEHGDLCYPSGLGMYLTVVAPVAAIILANFVVFAVITHDICKKGPECSENCGLIFQWRIVVLLFFMLGLTWSFGLLSYVDGGLLFLYLFCFFSTLQGFMLFLFFIVFNEPTRRLYVNLFKRQYRKRRF